jgi:hypothetical protein
MAIRPVSFFFYVRAYWCGRVPWQDIDICLDNGQTNERLVVKTIDPSRDPFVFQRYYIKLLLISRYPMRANQEWIEANEQEIVEGKFRKQDKQIRFEL